MDEIKEAQGWNDATMLLLAEEFISARGMQDAFVEFLKTRADEENEECQ